MEHWLPLFEERLDTLFDHLGGNDLIVREAGTAPAADQRFEAIADYFQNREKAMSAESGSYRPLPPELLYLDKDRWYAVIEEQPVHLATGFHEPESDRVIDCGVYAPRDFTPARTAPDNVYEAVPSPNDGRQRGV